MDEDYDNALSYDNAVDMEDDMPPPPPPPPPDYATY
jgi:hypothetical protein